MRFSLFSTSYKGLLVIRKAYLLSFYQFIYIQLLSKGLYPEQIARWKQACIEGAGSQNQREQAKDSQLKIARKQIIDLEKDLRRKEKALAESAALLVLQKKFNALWEDAE